MEETLARSREAPLSLAIYVDLGAWDLRDSLPSVITSVLPHTTRAKELVIRGADISPYVEPLFKHAAPLLETLELHDTQDHFSIRDKTLFPGQTSFGLRSLILKRCSFAWPIPFLFSPTLTTLKISRMLPDERPSLLQIREVLATLPNLRIIVLTDVMRTSPPPSETTNKPVDAESKVPLPCLQSLSFASDKAVDIVTFVSELSVPTDAALRLVCRTLEGFDVDEDHDVFAFHPHPDLSLSGLSDLMLSIVKFFGFNSRSVLDVAERDATDGYRTVGVVQMRRAWHLAPEWCVIAGTTPCDTGRQEGVPVRPSAEDVPVWNARFLLPLAWPEERYRTHHMKSILHNVCHLLPLSKVETIIVNCDLFDDPRLWWHTFGRLRHVKAVVVAGRALCGFAAALSGQGRAAYGRNFDVLSDVVKTYRQDDEPWSTCLFPDLCHLKIDNASLGWEDVMEDLTAGLEGLLQYRGLWDGHSDRPRGKGPLLTLLISDLPESNAERTRRESLICFVKRWLFFTHVPPVDPTPKWFGREWGRVTPRDYF
ncbi:hypothetical protein BV25DRAFT_1921576 [Artomyces pyxidatus]|uniref:Uncharacterized protein n=1 Tax=Artomyces pyxidatus TaxID=48021 RepID=A0ACB8SIV1_9AGAM|nr:hypothetical protein BV25DRAFT_1921576 [Artomyces pyxidatus]